MATPYYTKQPVYLEDPSGRFDNILSNKKPDPIVKGPMMNVLVKPSEWVGEDGMNGYMSKPVYESVSLGGAGAKSNPRTGLDLHGPTRLNFPFTPTISVIQSATYNSYDFDHSNFQQRAFVNHTNMDLNITAPMLVRSEEEAEYVYNASVWIRSTMKMQWANDDNPGQPPPILRFNSHGIYNNVPCVVRDFTWNLDSDIDYVECKGKRVPVMNMFVLSLTVSYSPKSKDYLSGNLKDEGYV
jgi:hypothetical protein